MGLLALYSDASAAWAPPEEEPTVSRSYRSNNAAPAEKRVKLTRDSSNKTGIADVIVSVVRDHPGLDMTGLADWVMASVVPDPRLTRKSIRNNTKYLSTSGRLFKNADGRFVLGPKERTKDDQLNMTG